MVNMEGHHQRPSKELVKKAYDHLLNPTFTISKLKDSALEDRLLPFAGESIHIPGRSLAWKLFMVLKDPLQSSYSLRASSLIESIRISRQNYMKLLRQHMRAPDGSYDNEGPVLHSTVTAEQPPKSLQNLDTNNPLSLHRDNPWKEWFAAVELRKTILLDVERTFPDMSFFRNAEIHLQLRNILFLYSVLNPSIGYRQGMHEVLAPLYYSVDYDSILPDEDFGTPEMQELCSRHWVAADAWMLFDKVMLGLSKYYEWRDPLRLSPLDTFAPHIRHVEHNASRPDLEGETYVPPILDICRRIQSELLQLTDPLLWKSLQATSIEPQMYGIRWLRLLFTREFQMVDALKLWDSLFASDPSLELAEWVCVAMLIRIRNKLIPADYSSQLAVLLRYPSLSQVHSNHDHRTPHHTTLLLRQALALQMSPTSSTGSLMVLENRDLLNVHSEIPHSMPQLLRNPSSWPSRFQDTLPSDANNPNRQITLSQPSLPDMLSRGWLGRGESLGINKTLMSAVSEIRRNIPDLAASLVRPSNASYPTLHLTDERLVEEGTPWQHHERHELEQEILQLRLRNRRLGECLSWIVDILQDETEPRDRKRKALQSLSHVRDILFGSIDEIEENKLVDTDSRKRKKSVQENVKPIESTPHSIPAVERYDDTQNLGPAENPRPDFVRFDSCQTIMDGKHSQRFSNSSGCQSSDRGTAMVSAGTHLRVELRDPLGVLQ